MDITPDCRQRLFFLIKTFETYGKKRGSDVSARIGTSRTYERRIEFDGRVCRVRKRFRYGAYVIHFRGFFSGPFSRPTILITYVN